MATQLRHQPPRGTPTEGAAASAGNHAGGRTPLGLTSERVWHDLSKATFAYISYVTPSGEARVSGVGVKARDRRFYLATAPDGWKARHIATGGRVSMTIPVRRGGLLSLLFPIPPATITFQGTATVYPHESPTAHALLAELGSSVPPARRASASIIEVIPEGTFLTYGVGVPLKKMLDPAAASGRVGVR